jgi:S-adenosylmethionine decarboxylase
MFYEGAEKKFEVVVHSQEKSLRQYPDTFWQDIIYASKSDIVSLENLPYVDSYILSESSLLVWDHRLHMLTCGDTTLADSVCQFLQNIDNGIKSIESLLYQRINEYIPKRQLSHFDEDIKKISNMISGNSLQFGEMDAHHNLIFSAGNKRETDHSSCHEIHLYHFKGEFYDCFNNQASSEYILSYLNIIALLDDFHFHDHVFSPKGYSLNATRDQQYLVIHVTPEDNCAYMSVQTNLTDTELVCMLFNNLIKKLNPDSIDIITIGTEDLVLDLRTFHCVEHCVGETRVHEILSYRQYVQMLSEIRQARVITI